MRLEKYKESEVSKKRHRPKVESRHTANLTISINRHQLPDSLFCKNLYNARDGIYIPSLQQESDSLFGQANPSEAGFWIITKRRVKR